MDVEKAQNEVDKNNPKNKRKDKSKGCKLSLYGMFLDFVSNTSLHGLRYLNESISVIEKLFWFITFIISIGLCSYLISNVWHKWQHNPVIVSFNEQLVPVWKVPFPAVTICPQMKCKKTVYNYSEEYFWYVNNILLGDVNVSDVYDKLKLLDDITTVCDELTISFSRDNTTNSSLIENIRKVAPDKDDIFEYCDWRREFNYNSNCSYYFKEVVMDEGVCFTFNTLSEDEMFVRSSIQKEYKYIHTDNPSQGWSMTAGYTAGEVNDTYPRKGQENSIIVDLDVILKERNADRDTMCNNFNTGFKVYLHHPADMPRSSHYYYAVVNKQVTALAVKFDMVSTSDTLKDYSVEKRQCHFPTDRKLKYFRHYTLGNCELECVSNYTYKICGCVWFNMPYNDSRHICTAENVACALYDSKDKLIKDKMKIGSAAEGAVTEDCNCLPPCDSVSYDAEVLKTYFDYKTYVKLVNKKFNFEDTDVDKYNYSRLVVYFKEPSFISRRRSELYGTTDFIANCGGLLGLFLGFSFLSLIEILYFSTLRVCCLFRRKRRSSRENAASKEE